MKALEKEVIEKRKTLLEEQGFWVCPKCKTKYYLGINCDICMNKEFVESLKRLVRESR